MKLFCQNPLGHPFFEFALHRIREVAISPQLWETARMRTGILATVGLAICGLALGCQSTDNAAMHVPIREDYVSPPDETRYNQPPESAYKAPPPKKDWGSKPGQGGGVGGPGQ